MNHDPMESLRVCNVRSSLRALRE